MNSEDAKTVHHFTKETLKKLLVLVVVLRLMVLQGTGDMSPCRTPEKSFRVACTCIVGLQVVWRNRSNIGGMDVNCSFLWVLRIIYGDTGKQINISIPGQFE